MPWFSIPAAILGSAVIGGISSNAAANTQASAAGRAADLQQQQFDRTVALQEPFRKAGITGQNRLMDYLGLSSNAGAPDFGKYSKDFSMADFQADPGYAFRMSEGLKGLDRTAAARGGLISGGALKAATRYGGDLASQEYNNAFNRYQTNRSNQLQPLQSLAGQALTSSNTVGQAGQTMANNMGENYMGAANARASGYMGAANAASGGVGQYLNYNQGQNMLSMFGNRGMAAPTGYGGPALPNDYMSSVG
jgi:hypothetical protein